jgi:hypothetical protein
VSAAILGACSLPLDLAARADELTRLKYNHPGLVVDLGVGLWAWPIPCDADGDGDFDLIVSCPDKPSNGVWLFENTTGDTAREKFPVFKPARRLSATVYYVLPSYVDGQLRVLSPGLEYPDFLTSGLAKSVPLAAPKTIHTPLGNAKNGRANKIRHNQRLSGKQPLDFKDFAMPAVDACSLIPARVVFEPECCRHESLVFPQFVSG